MSGPSARLAYERWHRALGIDPVAGAPWHELLKASLQSEHDLAGRRVLEIGCGRGDFACWVARQPAKPRLLVAADFALVPMGTGSRHASEHGLRGLAWTGADIERLPYPDEIFDTVISAETIEHSPEPRGAVAELARVLKPGGRLYVTTPNYLGPMGLYRAYCRTLGRRYTEGGQPINHLMFLPRTWGLVKAAGLRVLAIDAVGHYAPLPGQPPIRIRAFDRARVLTRWFGLHSLIVAEKRHE